MSARTIAVLVGSLLIATAGARGELLINPGAETGDLTGWTKGGVSNPFVDNGSFNPGINPHSGRFDFVGGNGASGSLTQNVLLAGVSGITDNLIDSSRTSAVISFWEQGLNQGNQSDNGFVSLTFRNSTNSVISSVSSPVVDSHNLTWQEFSGSFAIPVGTRSIDYTMNFTRHVGSDLDAYFDDNTLNVVSTAVPEPASLVNFFTGALVVGCYVFRQRVKFLCNNVHRGKENRFFGLCGE
jgi:hypothetical protein